MNYLILEISSKSSKSVDIPTCFYFPHNSNRKKLWHFESRIGVLSSPIFDDFKCCTQADTISWTISSNPPPKKGWKSGTLLFFHTFFAFSSHMRPTTYPKVMIFYLKGNSMFLNTFLTILSCQNDFYRLSASRNQICSTKKRQKKWIFLYVFCAFFVEQF